MHAYSSTYQRHSINLFQAVLYICALFQCTAYQAAAPDVAPVLQAPREFVDPEARISGGPVSGLVFAGKEQSVWDSNSKGQFKSLYAYVEGKVGEINVYLTTIDGRYLYSSLNKVPPGPNRWVQVQLQPNEIDFLRQNNYSNDEISVLVSPKTTNLKTFQVFPARWGAYTVTDSVRIFFKSEGYNVSLMGGKCSEISGNSRRAFKYDQICLAPTREKIIVRTRRGGDISDPVRLKVTLPDAK